MKRIKRILTLLLALATALSLAACGTQKDEPAAGDDGTAAEEKKLVIYSAATDAQVNAVVPLFEERYGIEVEVITGGTGELLARIDAEGEVLYDGLYELPEEYDFIPWAHYEYNLDQYKGKTIYIAFRHHECSGQYLLMIDDINVYQHGYEPSTSIDGVSTKNGFNKVKSIYSLDGQQHEKLQRGVNVVRMGDGSTRKVVIK